MGNINVVKWNGGVEAAELSDNATAMKDKAFIVFQDSTKTCTARLKNPGFQSSECNAASLGKSSRRFEGRIAFIFKVSTSMDFEALKKIATRFIERSGATYPATQHHIQKTGLINYAAVKTLLKSLISNIKFHLTTRCSTFREKGYTFSNDTLIVGSTVHIRLNNEKNRSQSVFMGTFWRVFLNFFKNIT
jgi:hypothetical protein